MADPSVRKGVITLTPEVATIIIGAGTLMVAFTTLVLKIIEVARSK